MANLVLKIFRKLFRHNEKVVFQEAMPNHVKNVNTRPIILNEQVKATPKETQIKDIKPRDAEQLTVEKEERKTISYIAPIGSTQEEIIEYLCNAPKGITFIHGKAGCGKTYLLQKIEKNVRGSVILTPTNLSRSMYRGASTMHSFFFGAFDNLDEGYQNPDNLASRAIGTSIYAKIQATKILIIDEISMVRSDTFEMMNKIFQKVLSNKEPFGGIPTVVVGDMFQLPPVVEDKAIEQYLQKEYGGFYFFHSHVIKDNLDKIRFFELTKSFRQQNDATFVEILDL